MSQTLDRILEAVRHLSPDERRQLREELNHEAHTVSFPAQDDVQAKHVAFVKSIRGKYG